MRRGLVIIMLTSLGVGLLGLPAAAGNDETRMVIPLEYSIPAGNPCTGEPAWHHLSGEVQIFALPSVEAFFNGEAKHATLKWVMEASTSDGYVAPWQHFATFVLNDRDRDNFGHVVVSETDNWMFDNGDGGKFKLGYRHHVTVVDGELKAFAEAFSLRCVRHSAG